MAKVTYDNVVYDSDEELSFRHWLCEALEHGFIDGFYHHPDSFPLTPSFKGTLREPKTLKSGKKNYTANIFRPHGYRPDFLINPNDKFFTLDTDIKKFITKDKEKDLIYVDTKGGFQRNGGDRSFKINCKLVMEKYNVHIHKVMPDEFFIKTFVPNKVRLTNKTKVVKKKFMNVPTIEEYLKNGETK